VERKRTEKGTFKAKHGLRNHPLYRTWQRMKNRCYNNRSKDYKDYGKRGIVVCDLWKEDFEEFYHWALRNGWEENLTIERIDFNKGYSPDNCKWIPMSEQSKNRRTVRNITYRGETHTITEWAMLLGIARRTLTARLDSNNFTIEQAFETPINKNLARR